MYVLCTDLWTLSHVPTPVPIECDYQCYCGTTADFANLVASDQCGLTYPTLCTGDGTTACGGVGAISVYVVSGVVSPLPPPPVTPETTYTMEGCFADSKTNRIMGDKMVKEAMSAEVSLCGR